MMIDTINDGKDLGLFQKLFLVCLTIILVITLFFLRNGFKANAMLDQLAKDSLLPDIALTNGKPTVFEFYADWCEACKEMAPDMIEVKKQTANKVDVVLLNVDNSRWVDLIDKYDCVFGTRTDKNYIYEGAKMQHYLRYGNILMAKTNSIDAPEIKIIEASKNIYFSNNKDISAKGDKLFMDVDKKFVSIEGNVEFSQGKSIIRAEKINVDLVTETVDFEGIKDSFIKN